MIGSTNYSRPNDVLCTVCSAWNPDTSAFCSRCRAPLDSSGLADVERLRAVVEELSEQQKKDRTRSRLIRMGLVLAVVLAIVGWRTFDYLGTVRFMGGPASAISAEPVNGEWPMYHRSPSHSAFVDSGPLAIEGLVQWTFETESPIRASPSIVGDRVFLATGRRGVVALDAETGDQIWQFELDEPVNSSPAVAGDLVFVGLRDGRVVALRKDTGEIEWEFLTQGRIFSSPAVRNGVLYIGSGDRNVYVIDALTGEERWRFETADAVVSSPAVNDKIIAVSSFDRELYILDANTAKRRLSYRTSFAQRGGPAIDEDHLYIADDKGILRAIDWTKREYPLEKGFRALRFHIFHYGFSGSPPQQKGFVWGFAERGHESRWSPDEDDSNVYVASGDGTMFAVDRMTGLKTWEFVALAGIDPEASPSVAGDTILLGDTRGHLYGLDSTTGELQWTVQVDGAIRSTPVVADGVVYVTTAAGTLLAIR